MIPKAYEISADDAYYSEVIWAETSGKAKRIALDWCESMQGLDYIELRARRLPKMDSLYAGKQIADWHDTETRVLLVTEYGWHCAEPDIRDCEVCPARLFCDEWDAMQEDELDEVVE